MLGDHQVPCNGNGVCNDTSLGDGACLCDAAWRGAVCNVKCQGVLSTGEVCSGHGDCLSDGSCQCSLAQDGTVHWTGSKCDACAAGWVGVDCDKTCPKGANSTVLCGGHGRCQAETETCLCSEDDLSGFWSAVAHCADCVASYFGASCLKVCPGGTCNPCSGHGACADGRAGSGLCTCLPEWQGPACSRCANGRFGLDCSGQCPSASVTINKRTTNQVCAGRGQCLDGQLGSGACVCVASYVTGFWAGTACGNCVAGYWGSACTKTCPASNAGAVCHGHGTCNDGINGTGACTCAPDWGGPTVTRSAPPIAASCATATGSVTTASTGH